MLRSPVFAFLLDLVVAVAAPRAVLVAENLLLRQQLVVACRGVKRPRLRRFDRWLFGALAGRSRRLLDAILLVKPATVIRWHGAAWRLLWRWRSRRPAGRPPVDADLRALIRQMWRENPTWGQKIIAAELAKLGYHASPRTVAKYRPVGLDRQRGQRWTTFIRNHLHETWACNFFVLLTGRFRVLYVFVVLSLERREIVHTGVTANPSAKWAAQGLVEATSDGRLSPRFLVHDRDSIYGADFRRRVRGPGTRLLATPPRAPQANAYCERVIGTLRRDCFDHLIVRDEHQPGAYSASIRPSITADLTKAFGCSHPMAPETCLQPDRPGQLKSSASLSLEVSIIDTVSPPCRDLRLRRSIAPLDLRMDFLRPTG